MRSQGDISVRQPSNKTTCHWPHATSLLASPIVLRHNSQENNCLNRGHCIKPLTLTRFWHRRICEAVILIAATILALYFWAYFADVKSISAALLVSNTSAILAGASLATSIVLYFWAPKKYIFWSSFAVFLLLYIVTGALVVETGGTSSPFIALWMIISVFAGVFGVYGLLPLFIAITAYLILQFTGGVLTREAIVTVVLTGELPLAISYLIWHQKASGDDSTDRAYRELATELSQVAGKAEVVINAISDGVVALNSQGVIQLINPAAQQIIGWGKQDALALDYKSVLKLVDKDDNELTPANDPVSQVLATNKEVASNNFYLMTNSGKKLAVSIVVSPVGQLGAGVIIVFRDITKQKAEEREQAEFISTASHEMRTPVASIEGYLGLALNPSTAQIDEKARDFITKAHESAQHLGRLFQDLLDVSKADDGRLSNNPKVVDVVAFTQDIVQGLRPKAVEKGLRVLFKPNPDDSEDVGGERRLNPVYYANVDNDHLREVFSNLVENAIKYTPKGEVVIDVTGDTDHVVISVADSGIGIPKEDQVHLFQKFYRVDNSDTREIGGTGLGLYLSRRLAEAMGGRIWLESEYKKGSTFYLELPRIAHEEATRLIESAITQEETPITNVQTFASLPETPGQPPATTPTPVPQPTPVAQPQPAQYAPASSEVTYTNTPVDAVARQLQTISAAPTQVQPQPAQYTPISQSPPNIPLTSIEQNPAQYTRPRTSGVSIPPREQN
jgi:PAS domain S-box-containing protein